MTDAAINKSGDRRFVVLRHEDGEGVHYDLMIENGERLATWKLTDVPESAARSPRTCRRIGEHRRIYLDYEGSISGGRGHVTRHDRGDCRLMSQQEAVSGRPGRWRIEFFGDKLQGRYELTQLPGQESGWSFRCLDA